MDVLFVDDERPVLEQAKLFLEDLKDGMRVETSNSARDAIDKIRMKRYDAVVSDYLMPNMDGLDFLEKLRNQGEDIPFVILTGRGGESIAMEALNEGADFYMTKTGDPKSQYEELGKSIERVINRKKARKDLEGKVDLLLKNAPEGIIINDEYGNILYANNFIFDLLGYSEEDLFLMNMTDLDLILNAESTEGYYWNRMETDEHIYLYSTYSRSDMTDVDVKIKVTKLRDEGRTFVINFVEELTELRSRDRFKIFFEKVPEVGFIVNKNGILEDISKTFCKTMGLPKKELIGRDFKNLSDILSIENSELLEEGLEKFRTEKEIEPFSIKVKDKDGNVRYIKIETDIVTIDDRKKLFGTACNITERVEAEEREDFLHSMLTHDIKNKAQVMRGYLDLIKDTDLNDQQKKLISKSSKALEKSVDLVNKVDTMMKIPEIKKEEIRVKPIIDSIVSEIDSKANDEGIDIDWDMDDVKVMGGSLLEDLFLNIIINSIKHSQGSKIRIRSKIEDDEVIIIFEDDGIGIDDELKKIIFEKNSRKGRFAGTGLGMYIARKIANSLEGDILVKDSEFGGARFDVYLKKA